MVGYDGGRVAPRALADHVIVTRSQHIPRIQEAQASAYHVLRELVERAVSATRGPRAPRACDARRGHRAGRRVPALRLPPGATSSGSAGFVLNDERGVLLEAEGDARRGRAPSWRGWRAEAPPLADVERVRASELARHGGGGFAIVESERRGAPDALVSPDTATCEDCLRELFDPADRRHRYPFINCTNCGPRFTIVRGVPYDRPLTTMAGFEMCAACRAEYEDPRDRRFHAQPNACPACGPRLRLLGGAGPRRRPATRWPRRPRRSLARRRSSRSRASAAITWPASPPTRPRSRALRARKHREDKPFALMAADARGGAGARRARRRPTRRC